ncbi:helix-turn-helix domain-containing protein [Marimonas lutisalis]|uniref:helix-turn-helix domain-containing protein n=1 Tax=Marimonas lutisalis TaxID=2545756 RepID=UPI0010F61A53|nr:helix-turn-helix domain-containing protein [Marimonas lutisalis]
MPNETLEVHAPTKAQPWWTDIYHMRPKTAARYLGISPSTLAKLRMRQNRQDGPVFSKIAGLVVYRRADLDLWLQENSVKSSED